MAKRNALTRYKQKRDFTKTAEPAGETSKKAGNSYLVQKHDATRLHYDLRLELDGVLKSWAVTRGPSLDPHDKRLAVEVEDHPVSYGSFEGTIPEGQYGGGTVMLWDQGTWEPVGDAHDGLKKGKLVFKLHGKRLKGEWTLVRMRGREQDKGRKNWLLIKHKDEEAHEGDDDALLTKHIRSVASGRTMENIAVAKDAVWRSEMATPVSKRVVRKSPVKKAGEKAPPFRPPQLATLTDAVPRGKDWLHEVKFDGYRALAYLQNGHARVYTRTGLDWTHKFRAVAESLETIPVGSAIVDGEIVALDAEGKSSFKTLQKVLSEKGTETQVYVFDLLYLNGKDLTHLPLRERKSQLQMLLRKATKLGGRVLFSEHFEDGDKLLQQACKLHLEGVISKRADAPYLHRRSTSWLKTKCHTRQEFVIGGFTPPKRAERGIGALLIGYYENGKCIFAGKVGTGFDHETSLELRRKLEKLEQPAAEFEEVPADGRRNARWVRPQLVCEVEFTEWTPDGRLRHPSFQGLRDDKPAHLITRDIAMAKRSETPVQKPAAGKKDAVVGGITITHPGRIVYPGTDITKAQLAEYYFEVADYILPHLKNRPVSLLRCPEGIGGQCFFQRHISRGQSPHVHEAGIKVKGRNEEYLMIKDVKGLVSLAQWGVIELHPWGCLADKPDLPDRIIFDLDPDPELAWKLVIEGAKEIRDRMNELKLESFVKTTGGKGLHVVIPLSRSYPWEPVKAFARAIADSMQHDNPGRYIARSSKEARKGKIFVDYLRNELTATAVAAYSARARPGAPVAIPVSWAELKASLHPADITVKTTPSRLANRKADPWADFFKVKQKIAAAYLKALRVEF